MTILINNMEMKHAIIEYVSTICRLCVYKVRGKARWAKYLSSTFEVSWNFQTFCFEVCGKTMRFHITLQLRSSKTSIKAWSLYLVHWKKCSVPQPHGIVCRICIRFCCVCFHWPRYIISPGDSQTLKSSPMLFLIEVTWKYIGMHQFRSTLGRARLRCPHNLRTKPTSSQQYLRLQMALVAYCFRYQCDWQQSVTHDYVYCICITPQTLSWRFQYRGIVNS